MCCRPPCVGLSDVGDDARELLLSLCLISSRLCSDSVFGFCIFAWSTPAQDLCLELLSAVGAFGCVGCEFVAFVGGFMFGVGRCLFGSSLLVCV